MVAHVVDILDKSVVLLPERHVDQANNNWLMSELQCNKKDVPYRCSLYCSEPEHCVSTERIVRVGRRGGCLTGSEVLSAV